MRPTDLSRRLALLLTVLLFTWFPTSGVGQDFYYYKDGARVPLELDGSKNFVLLNAAVERQGLEATANAAAGSVSKFEKVKPFKNLNLNQEEGVNLAADAPAMVSSWAIVEGVTPQLNANSEALDKDVAYRAPFFKMPNGQSIGISHLLYVKLKAEGGKKRLSQLAKELNVKIVGNNKFMPLWYTLAVDKNSKGDALQVANQLFESGSFAIAEPDFLSDFRIRTSVTRTNDTLYDQQWALENTGQDGGTPGIDINGPEAWVHATGQNVKVAVLDHGIDLEHPDLPNVDPNSFDTVTGSSPSTVRGNHGTPCAGIIGAAKENSLGIAGIAPDATLMSISDSLLGVDPNAQQRMASGLSWAWQNGADVISNSWGHNSLSSSMIDDAIHNALTQGRNGKGCVVVFSAGNENGSVIYPANRNPDVICVGAMSPCGERKNFQSCDGENWWGSCFGSQLDIMAPGVLIASTDRTGANGYSAGDYTMNFNGTSSACPFVAGVAALILQVDPNLTQSQVADILESSAQKVGNYSYSNTFGRPNGTWHYEMGYGLVDAAAAVQLASQGPVPSQPGGGGLAGHQDSQPAATAAVASAAHANASSAQENRPANANVYLAEPGYLDSFSSGPSVAPAVPVDQQALNAGFSWYNNVGVNLNTRLIGTSGTTQISVYARDIRWSYRFTGPNIRRPEGNGGQGGDRYRFPLAHRMGITIYQGDRYWNVTSMSANSPTVIAGLTNTEDVIVTVNDTNGNYSDNHGAFDIFVRRDN